MEMLFEDSGILLIDGQNKLDWKTLCRISFENETIREAKLSPQLEGRLKEKREVLLKAVEEGLAIYGVSTGFGASSQRRISKEQAEQLQNNLVNYLSCGSGKALPIQAARATVLVHLNALSKGMSGVSPELLTHMALFVKEDWVPVIPCEGSLGASGDLVPLAHVAQSYLGRNPVYVRGNSESTAAEELPIPRYELKAKEGLSLVNGTSTMTGMSALNLRQAEFLLGLAEVAASWQCLSILGREEAFSAAVNSRAKKHPSQSKVASKIMGYLEAEDYSSVRSVQTTGGNLHTERPVQDKYSLRCSPQVLGPIADTLDKVRDWIIDEANSCSDNPVIDDTTEIHSGGNFYGGYLSHGMDYLKISLANMADLMDRQLCVLVDEKHNGGLPPNLANWASMDEDTRHLHHGLKGLHQSMSAICSEVIQKSMPASVLSRSSESHNQDKVSLGMSASMQCQEMLEKLFTMSALQMACLAQALDLRGRKLKGLTSIKVYKLVREFFPFVEGDQRLDGRIQDLRNALVDRSVLEGSDYFNVQ